MLLYSWEVDKAGSGGPGRVWTYWEDQGDRVRPPYLDLCAETIRHHLSGLALEVVDARSALELLPDLDEALWRRLPDPVRRSDYCRIRLLHRYGGAYLDVDCVAVAALTKLLEPLESHSFVCFGAEESGVQNGFLAARPGAPFLERWIEAQDRILADNDDWTSLPQTALGERLATPISSEVERFSFPERTISPVMWYEWGRFFSRATSPDWVFRHAPLTVMLFNQYMAGPLRDTSAGELLSGKILLSRLFRVALGVSTAEDESDGWTRLDPLADLFYSRRARALRARIRAARRQPSHRGQM